VGIPRTQSRVTQLAVAAILICIVLPRWSALPLSTSATEVSNSLLWANVRSLLAPQDLKHHVQSTPKLAVVFSPSLNSSFWRRDSTYFVGGIIFLLAEAMLIFVFLLERKRRMRAQASIARRFALERVVSELSGTLSDCSAESVAKEIEKGLNLILEAEAADRVCWFAIPEGGTTIEKVCSVHGPGTHAGPSLFQAEDVPWVAARISRGEPVPIASLEDLPPTANRDRRYLEELGIKSMALVPTTSRTSATGLLILVYLVKEREWPGAMVDRLGVVGNLFGNALSRARAQKERRTSDELFRTLFDQASLGIALEDLDGHILFANPALCKMLGREEKEMQQMSCDQIADVEDSREDAALFQRLRAGLIDSYRIEKRYMRPNGTEMWGNLHVSMLREGRQDSSRVIAMIEDITDRKAANKSLEKAQFELQQLTGRLILAQEEERQRISRELHDDIGQRLSLLVIGLDRLHHEEHLSGERQATELTQLQNHAEEIVGDIHELSHELHSTKLQHLGLKSALNELCRRISAQWSIEVDLQVSDLPHLGSDVQLCLYRIAQEALNNVLKHSASTLVTVTLMESNDVARLQIKDTGIGFDISAAAAGLGLLSMRERLRIVGGALFVDSIHNGGTEIIAEVPLSESGDVAQAS
jgi:PAS domain S-box-containing protein